VTDDTLMLLDTPSLYYRAYFGVPESLTAPDGMPVNAVRGLLEFITHLVTTYRPARLVACFDADWRPAFRVAAIPSYKAHRVAADDPDAEQTPDTLAPQVPIILDALDAFGIARAEAAGFEADDVIGTLATTSRTPVDIVTGDRDLFQLVDDARGVRVLYTARGVGKHDVIDDAAVTAKYGLAGGGGAYADFAALRGDPSDGLPGVPGVGEKTAAALINTYGTLDGLLAAADDPTSGLRPAMRVKLDAARPYLSVAPEVVRVRTDAPVSAAGSELPTVPAQPDHLTALAERYGLAGPITRLVKALT
jgi:5'-3' exonuclease